MQQEAGLRLKCLGGRPPLFSINTWDQREAAADGLARTTNIVEGWHHSLQVILQCSHPTLWKFLSQLMNDCSKQKASLLQRSTGIEQPAVKRYRILRDRVMRAVATSGRTDVLTYLRSMAYLSFN